MSPRSHSKKVMAEATEKKAKNPFRCGNCGKTFESESQQRSHENTEHPKQQKK
ncbi:MAG TPA: hypothetical protein VJ732_12335 [Bryobacteraceae bacterium]|nr:hypothetical protein [Bryobacteraceae bacterium]